MNMQMGARRVILLAAILLISGAASVFAQVTGLSGWNIYLDPGHSQTANMGIYGYSEAEKNLRVGLALRELLLETTDIDTVYISRTNDQVSVGLSQRSSHANTLGAAWFHSIHSDAGNPHSNSTLLLWGQLKNGQEKTPPGGHALSDIMSPMLARGMRTNDRGSIGDCSFYGSFRPTACAGGGPYLSVNRRTTMPSELSEAGFHTNPTQNQRNMNAEWKRLEAWTFYWSILEHHGISRPEVRIVTGIVSNLETARPINGAVITIGDQEYTTDTFESLFHKYSSDPDQLRNGFYFFDDLELDPASVTISVEAENFKPLSVEITPIDSFFTFADIQLVPAIPPQIATSEPVAGDTHRVVDPIAISFTRPMDRPSTEAAFSLDPPVTGRFTWSSDFGLTFRPDSLRSLTEYVLRLGETAEGRLGDGLDGNGDGISGDDFVVHFRTGFPDVRAPVIVGNYPRQRSRGVEIDPIITFVYDELVDSTSISGETVSLTPTAGGEALPGRFEHYVVGEQSVPTFFPETDLESNTVYRYTIEGGVRDIWGNEDPNAKNLFFTTGSTRFDRTIVDAFEGDLGDWWVPQQSGSTSGIITTKTGRRPDSTVVNHLTRSTSAMRLNYGWDTSAAQWLIRVFLSGGAPRRVLFDSTFTLEAYVFGDGGGSLFRFAVDDRLPEVSASNHEVSPWVTVDWLGWRLVTWRSSIDGVGSWLGDGSLDGTLRFDSIQLTRGPNSADIGTLYIDDLRISKKARSPVATSEDEIPNRLELYQNYPNPFNPTTRLRFDVPSNVVATLKVYNVGGSEVATLVDGRHFTSGTQEVIWDASNVPSGVYLARLETSAGTRVIRMILLR